MKRTASLVAAVCLLTTVGAGCTSDDAPPPTASPSPSAPASATPTSTPAWVRPTPEPISAKLDEGDGGLVWESFTPHPDDAPGWFRFGTRLFDRETGEFWRLRNPEGVAFSLILSEYHDVALAIAPGSTGTPAGRTVLLDLNTGRVRALTSFPLLPRSWADVESLDAGSILVDLDQRQGASGSGLPAGAYEVDLEVGEIRRVLAPEPASRGVPLPDDSALPAGSLSLRTLGSDGSRSFVLWERDGSETIIMDRVDMAWWNPGGTAALLEQRSGQTYELSLTLFDALTGDLSDVPVGRADGSPNWSPDGRYVALSSGSGTVTIFEFRERELSPILGPFEGSVFADWGPDESPDEVLLLANYCSPEDAFMLDRLDLASGDVRRIPTAVGGFWVYDWSPDGGVIAASSGQLDGGFALLDPDSGEDVTPPVLREVIENMQDVQWSGSGRWLMAVDIGGRDRCM